MSFESRRIIDEDSNNKENDTVATYQRNTHFGSTVQHTSSMVINIRQLQTDLQVQHQLEKDTLTELNQRFHLFIDRIQSLQTQNSKYLAAIGDIRQKFTGISTTDIEENYFASRSNFSSVYTTKIDYEWDFELFQLQIGIYQRLIELEQQSKDKRILLLEEELKQSASILISLRTSYEQLQLIVENLHGESGNLAKQYLVLTHDWCNMKKQRKKWDLSMETLKNFIEFYRNLRSNVSQESKSLLISSDEMNQFWMVELDRVIKRIRHDFEVFYANLYQQAAAYYEIKTEELETNIKQELHYQQIEIEKFTMVQQKLQIEYEKVQTSLSYEKEVFFKLESTYNKLESDLKSIQLQYEERLDVQSNDLQSVQEGIMIMAYDVDEIRRSKANLEVEIIIYRQLLDAGGIETPMAIIPRSQSNTNETTGKFVLKRQRKGSIGIKDCAPNGIYISLVNSSTNRTIDISRWVLTRHIDTGTKFRYVVPDGVRLEPGRELRIYAKINGDGTFESTSYQKLINNNLVSWGEGNTIETVLFNQNGDEEASYSQSIALRRI